MERLRKHDVLWLFHSAASPHEQIRSFSGSTSLCRGFATASWCSTFLGTCLQTLSLQSCSPSCELHARLPHSSITSVCRCLLYLNLAGSVLSVEFNPEKVLFFSLNPPRGDKRLEWAALISPMFQPSEAGRIAGSRAYSFTEQ